MKEKELMDLLQQIAKSLHEPISYFDRDAFPQLYEKLREAERLLKEADNRNTEGLGRQTVR